MSEKTSYFFVIELLAETENMFFPNKRKEYKGYYVVSIKPFLKKVIILVRSKKEEYYLYHTRE